MTPPPFAERPAEPTPVATHIGDVRPGGLVELRATIVSTGTIATGTSTSFRVTLRESDVELDLLFLGRSLVRGFTPGMGCVAIGRAAEREHRLVVWNPRYELSAAAGAADTDVARTDVAGLQLPPAQAGDPTAETAHAQADVDESTAQITTTMLVAPTGGDDDAGSQDDDDDVAVAPAGRFRVYLGPAAGVGKTYAMLDEAHRRRQRGRDVVVAVVDTHGRAATAAQLDGLEVIPPKRVTYRGAVFEEMDLDAVLARHPNVALVDELAHTNIPGSGRNEKRWQDVLDLLAANISVISTVNIQHIESLADVVERVSGVAVRERVPDAVLRRADQIELVDSSPEQLRRRMLHGNIYPPDSARQALGGFFRTDTLAVLRELTLRFLADEIDDELLERLTPDSPDRRGASERVLVGVTPADGADTVLRRAARLAARLKADLYAVHVRSADTDRPDSAEVTALHILAEDLGANWQQLDGDPVTALMDFALQQQITQIVLGRSQRSRWQRFTGGGSTVRRLTSRAMSAGIDLHIVARNPDRPVTSGVSPGGEAPD